MTRLSAKTIIQGALPPGRTLNADFVKSEIDLTVRDKGYNVLYEKALRCPCKSQGSDHQSTCLNCGGSGWFFVNPTLTKMVMHSIGSDRKYKEVGREDLGKAELTCLDGNILSFMDRITILDGLTDHTEVLYPTLDDSAAKLFAFTKYNLAGIDYLGLFVNDGVVLNQLLETQDYTFHDNVIEFTSLHGATANPTGLSVSVRYLHAPVYHVIDITRDTMRSTAVDNIGKRSVINLPIHAIGVRSHLVKDIENYTGNRLLDNSFLESCDAVVYKAPVLPSNIPFYFTSAQNIGTGVGVFDGPDGRVLNFRNIKAGTNVSVDLVGADIVISSTGGGGGGSVVLIGDVTASGSTGSDITTTLATVNSNIGTFNNVTVNAKGLVTAASNVSYQSQLNGTGFVVANGASITYDNSTYLTTISGITAGGDLSGTYSSPTVAKINGTTIPALGGANTLFGVDNAGTGLEYKTVSNGLTSASGSLKLGGILSATTLVNTNSNTLTLSNNSAPLVNRSFNVTSSSLTMIDQTAGANKYAYVNTTGQLLTLRSRDGSAGNDLFFEFNAATNLARFTDSRASKKGLEYAATGYVTQTHSLTDKEYTDAHLVGYTFTNSPSTNYVPQYNGVNITWNPVSSGTVTSFSAGDLSPLFTTSVATASTTPALSFSLSSIANGNYVYASPDGGSGAPLFRALVANDIPSLSSVYVPVGRTITINGSTQDLSANRTYTITVTGTNNRISVSGGTGLTPTVDIDVAYVGQSSITTLGTIGTGVWQGTAITDSYISSSSNWNTAYNRSGTSLAFTSSTFTFTKQDASTLTVSVPTFNQNTTGSAAKWTTARNLAGNSTDGSANVTFANAFIVQGTTDAGLSGAQFLGALTTGIVKNTTTSGVLSIAVAGDFPTLNQNTTGSAATLTTGRTISITGDLSYTSPAFDGSGNITAAGTLATVNTTTGTFGSATKTVTITVNGKGLITAATEQTVTPAAGSITGLGTGVATALAINVGSAGAFITFNGAAGTPSSLIGTNITGTASGLTAGNVTTNANLTGPITSVGNATAIASQTGTGTTFMMSASPSFTGTMTYGTLGYSDTDIAVSFQKSVNSYFQTVWQNTSSGTIASTDLIISSDNGTATTHYLDIGKNSSGFTGSGSLNAAGYSYLTSTSDDLVIGTTTNNLLRFVTNSGTTDAMSIAGNGAMIMNATWTATANSQYGLTATHTATSRSTASDLIGGYDFVSAITANAATIDANGFIVDSYLIQQGGISTVNNNGSTSNSFESKNTAGMTATTYNNVAPASTSGSGTGALFTVIVASATGFTSIIITGTAGSGYRVGDTITFNGSQFGSGSGLITIAITAVVGSSLGTNASAFTIINRQADRLGLTKRHLDIRASNGTTSLFSFETQQSATSSTVLLNINDPIGQMLSSSGANITFGRTVIIPAGTSTIASWAFTSTQFSQNAGQIVLNSGGNGAQGTFGTAASGKTSSSTSLLINDNTMYFRGGSSGAQGANTLLADFGSVATALVGAVNTVSAPSGGTGYTAGLKATTGGSGTGLTVTISVSGGVPQNPVTINNRGTGYLNGETITIATGGANCTFTITAIDFSGVVNAVFMDRRSVTDPSSQNFYASVDARPTYNVTSTQVGTLAGLYYNPTLTATGSFNKYGAIIGPSNFLNGFGTTAPSANLHIIQGVFTSGWVPGFRVDAGAHTGLTTTTEFIANDFRGATQAWVDGTTTTQRFNYFRGFTLNKTTTSATFTNAYTAYIDPSTAGSGVTITNNYALGLNGNLSILDGFNITLGTTNGTKIGTATTQLIGFFNSTPIVQPANTVAIDTLLVNLGLRATGGVGLFDTDIKAGVVGKGFYVKEGTNGTMGKDTLVGGTKVVSTTKVTANSRIFVTDEGGTVTNLGSLYISARSAGASFTVTSTNILDVSDFVWIIFEPA